MNDVQNIDILTAEILILKNQTAQNIIEIGKRLTAVKESLPHGEWGRWLEEKVDFSTVTAQRFMRIANEFSNASALKDLGQTKIFALLELPHEERESFMENNPVNEMTTRQLNEAVKAQKQAEKERLEAIAEKNRADTDKARAEMLLKEQGKINVEATESVKKLQAELAKEREENEEQMAILQISLQEATAAGDPKELRRLQALFDEAERSMIGTNATNVNLERQLDELTKKNEALEKQLSEQPEEVNEIVIERVVEKVVEKVPDEIMKEIEELRASATQKENKIITSFRVHFEGAKMNLIKMVEVMNGAKLDEEVYGKCKNAFTALVKEMEKQL